MHFEIGSVLPPPQLSAQATIWIVAKSGRPELSRLEPKTGNRRAWQSGTLPLTSRWIHVVYLLSSAEAIGTKGNSELCVEHSHSVDYRTIRMHKAIDRSKLHFHLLSNPPQSYLDNTATQQPPQSSSIEPDARRVQHTYSTMKRSSTCTPALSGYHAMITKTAAQQNPPPLCNPLVFCQPHSDAMRSTKYDTQ